MFVAICVLLIVASVLLVLVVLIQNSKGVGLAANFAAGNQTFGVRQTADYLEKATWTLAIVVLMLSLAGTVAAPRDKVTAKSTVQQQMQNVQTGGTINFDPSQVQQPQQSEGQATPSSQAQDQVNAPAQPTEEQPKPAGN